VTTQPSESLGSKDYAMRSPRGGPQVRRQFDPKRSDAKSRELYRPSLHARFPVAWGGAARDLWFA
jgi:hypothetical protein